MDASRDRAMLLGLGLDSEDEQVRVTRGKEFHIVGGSRETHEVMQDKCIRFTEKLQDRGKRMADLHREEFLEIAAECEMNVDDSRPRLS